MIATNAPTTLPRTPPTRPSPAKRAGIRRPVREPAEALTLRGGKTDGASISRAIWAPDLLEAYEFLHQALTEQGFIPPSPGGVRTTCYDGVPETATFVAKATPNIIAVQSATADSEELGLPSDKAFFPEIGALRRDRRSICEASRAAISIAFQKSIIGGELMRCIAAYAMSMGCDEIVTAVQPWEARAHAEMGFEPLGPVRTFSSEVPCPAVLMGLRLDETQTPAERTGSCRYSSSAFLQDLYKHHNPYRPLIARWGILADQAFADPEVLREIFVRRTGLLARCTDQERAIIRKRWKGDLFDRVWPAEETEAACERRDGVINFPHRAAFASLLRQAG